LHCCCSPCVVVVAWGAIFPPSCHVQIEAWSTRLGKEKKGRFLNLKINSIILLCFDFYLFFDVFGFV